jgi:hypothetical protein
MGVQVEHRHHHGDCNVFGNGELAHSLDLRNGQEG